MSVRYKYENASVNRCHGRRFMKEKRHARCAIIQGDCKRM